MVRNKRNIALLLAVYCLQGMVFYSPIATLYRQAAGLDLLQIGFIESVCLGVMLALEIPWGIVADRIGHRRTIVICAALFALRAVQSLLGPLSLSLQTEQAPAAEIGRASCRERVSLR